MKKVKYLVFLLLVVLSLTSVAYADTYKDGSTGKAVEGIQQQLKKLGLYSGEVTGYFGPQTETAVKKFQLKRGLHADGVVGPGTYKYLFEGASKTTSAKANTQVDEKNVLSIKEIQTALKKLGYYKGTIDGVTGSNTENAVKAFQKANKLSADGVVGSGTAKVMLAAVDKTEKSESISNNAMSLKEVQTALKKLGYYTGTVDGVAGSKTTAAIQKFQKANKLTADGVVGTTTKNKLIAAVAQSSKTTKATTITTTTTKNTATAAAPAKETEKAVSMAEETATEEAAVSEEESSDEPEAEATVEEEPKKEPEKTVETAKASTEKNKTELLDWWKEASKVFKIGSIATITDVKTGKTFKIVRTYGTNHADVEALTAKDSQIIKDIWGGWSWTRRPVIVEVNDRRIAASMAAMPHAGVDSKPANTYVSQRSGGYSRGVNLDKVKNNGMSGHLDIHFLNSKTHGTNKVDSKHQAAVKQAAKY